MQNKSKKGLIAGFIVCLIFAVLLFFIAIFVPTSVLNFDETNTVEHQATITDVRQRNGIYEISVEEFHCALEIDKSEIVDTASLIELQSGNHIMFCIPKYYDELLYDSRIQSLDIVALYTANSPIVTFESHNKMINKSYVECAIVGVIFSILFFMGAVTFLVLLIIRIKRSQNDEVIQK